MSLPLDPHRSRGHGRPGSVLPARLALSVGFALFAGLALLASSPLHAHDGEDHGDIDPDWRPAPDALLDQRGEPFDPASLDGKTRLVHFVYTGCPGPCPVQTSALVEVQKRLPSALRERVHFVSISIDPARDSPAALAAYAEARHVDTAHWTLVSGGEPALADLRLRYGGRIVRDDTALIDHSLHIHLVSPQGLLVQTYAGNTDVGRLVEDLSAIDRLSGPSARVAASDQGR